MKLFDENFDLVNRRWRFLQSHLRFICSSSSYQKTPISHPCVILDIDSTLVCDDPTTPIRSNRKAVMFPEAHRFLSLCHELDLSVFLITARTSLPSVYELFAQNNIPSKTLMQIVNKIYVRQDENTNVAASKKNHRSTIRRNGYNIIMAVGDMGHDLTFQDDETMNEKEEVVNILIDRVDF